MKCLTIVIGFLCVKLIEGNIHSKLHYFETLKSLDVRSRERRSTDGSSTTHKEISFHALGRDFNLIMTPDSSVLSHNFKSYVIKADNRAEPFHINKNEFFKGRMTDEESVVSAHIEDSLWNIQVSTKDDIYALEPSWRHLPPSSNHTLIAYRHSDIKWDHTFPHLAENSNKRQKICESIHADVSDGEVEDVAQENHTETSDHDRQKRQAWLVHKNTCNLIVVADYKFTEGVGGGFKHRTSNYIIGQIQRIENIYRNTNWDPARGHVGFGFQIKEMRIHDNPTPVQRGVLHYNMKGDPKDDSTWNTRSLLEEFSRNTYFTRFCLAHLFTYQKFSGGVLGLAYIASPRLGTIGGVCSPPHRRSGGKRFILNTGWSSSMNTAGNQQLAQESTLVTAHELGHNWGSEHDVDTDECAPSSFNKGKYIMYPYAVSGWEENNYIFSPCSKRYVSDVIRAKAYKCFEEKKGNTPYCGNSIVDTGEMCDAGPDGDSCCSSKCRLINGAQCSPMNNECCENCQMASENFECRTTSENSCLKSTKCNGTSFDCPPAEPKPPDTPCVDEGQCLNGVCQSFCEVRNKEPCICNEPENACHRCCKAKGASAEECVDHGSNLGEGRPCYQGFCSKLGQCEKQNTELVFRFFDFIEKLTPSKFVEIMRSNIVGTVIVLSMIIWIPASWVFSCIDKREESEEREYVRNSRFLIYPGEEPERRIRVSEIRRIGRNTRSRGRTLSGSTGSIHSVERETSV